MNQLQSSTLRGRNWGFCCPFRKWPQILLLVSVLPIWFDLMTLGKKQIPPKSRWVFLGPPNIHKHGHDFWRWRCACSQEGKRLVPGTNQFCLAQVYIGFITRRYKNPNEPINIFQWFMSSEWVLLNAGWHISNQPLQKKPAARWHKQHRKWHRSASAFGDSFFVNSKSATKLPYPGAPWNWNIYLHEWL